MEEAFSLYQQIPPERMDGIPSIGINLHVKGRISIENLQADILSSDRIDIGFLYRNFAGIYKYRRR